MPVFIASTQAYACLFCVNLFYNLHTNIPADTDRPRADLTDVDGQSVECAHALLVDDLCVSS